MTFRTWLLSQSQRDDSIGDLARDVAADTCGKRYTSAYSLARHIDWEHDASDKAKATLKKAWREFAAMDRTA